MKYFLIAYCNNGYRSSGNVKLLFSLGIGLGIAGTLLYFHRKRMANLPPKKWRKVGEISKIICYPIKSCGPVRLTRIQCNQLGFENGNLRDRVFMIIDKDRNFITARAYPQLLQINPNIDHEKMIITAPDMQNFEINFDELYSNLNTSETASIWHENVLVIDCGDAVAKWLSQYISQKGDGFRLVFNPNAVPTRDIVSKHPLYKHLTQGDAGSFPDTSSYMLMNQSSIDDLNSRLDDSVTPLQFRPNFVVTGSKAFAEDKWNWIRIGDMAIFRSVKPCTRCIFTNIDPATSKRNPSFQPLKTLKGYRNIIPNDSPVMGVHLGVRSIGTVAIGDAVYAEDTGFCCK